MSLSILIDTNLYVSFLLTPTSRRTPIIRTIELVRRGGLQLVVPSEQFAEFENQRRKPKLISRIPELRWDEFTNLLRDVATVLPKQTRPFPRVVRDEDDDYLVAIAIWEDVDVIVSGDKDLLALREYLDRPRIMSPADFVAEFGDPDR
ncbi:MAG TPA: putative toxin-antitoxin system toxin component, PIN family [Thermomicrobiales bacterium]|nr:putative toxin-antitoxin system toxin component, PIN family [Thermomicrobiales bacterium]